MEEREGVREGKELKKQKRKETDILEEIRQIFFNQHFNLKIYLNTGDRHEPPFLSSFKNIYKIKK